MYTSTITCANCKDEILLPHTIGPFELVICPYCQSSAKFIDLQMKEQEEDQKLIDELINLSSD